MKMTIWLFAIAILLSAPALLLPVQSPANSNEPAYKASGELLAPQNYREWIWLSSGLGMAYGPAERANSTGGPPFDNVFVNPSSYRSFIQTGTWPDKSTFVLELRSSRNNESINKGGRFQGDLIGLEVEVKDERHFPGKWAFFEFPPAASSARPLPRSAECYSCHAEHGAVDNTFVQFYPTLIDVAKKHGTFRQD